MKHLFSLIFVLVISTFASAQIQTKPLLTKRTATWCPNCGTWGWDAMKDIIDRYDGGQATVLALHYSGDLADQLNIDLASNFPQGGQPLFALNNTNLGFGSSSWAAKSEAIQADIDALNATAEKASLDLEALIDYSTNSISIMAQGQNESLSSGEYSLGIYLVSDAIEANQSSIGMTKHFKIVYDKLTEETFGQPIFEGGATSYEIEYSLTYDPADIDLFSERSVVAILWKAVNGKYEVVNTDSAMYNPTVSSTADIANSLDANVWQNEVGDLVVELNSEATATDATVTLYSLAGNAIATQTLQNNKTVVSRSQFTEANIYVATIVSDGKIGTYKIYLR